MRERLLEFIRYSELQQLTHNIAALQQEKIIRSLTVLSFLPGEGKTLLCASIAMAYAENFRMKVLVVDTTTFQNKGSLLLKECFNGSTTLVDVMTLEDLRRNSGGLPPPTPPARADKTPVLESEIVACPPITISPSKDLKDNDFSLIKRVAEVHSKQYGLVLLDTTSIQAKNRSNVDPLLVARLSDASVVVVSRALLDTHNLGTRLKILEDPTLYLVGMISNEEFRS